MSLNSLILSTLEPITVPVEFRKYAGTETTYVTFFEMLDVPTFHGDDKLTHTRTIVQVDIWSKGNLIPLVGQVKTLMEQADFLYSDGRPFFEDDTGYHHYAITYNYSVKLS